MDYDSTARRFGSALSRASKTCKKWDQYCVFPTFSWWNGEFRGMLGQMFSEAGTGPQKGATQSSWNAGLSVSKRNLARAVYVTAILAATVGWLWLITWIALQLG